MSESAAGGVNEVKEAPPVPPEAAPTPDDATELSARAMNTLLLQFEKGHGRARLEELFRREKLSLSLDYVKNPANFVSLAFVERLSELLAAESADPSFFRKAGMLTATPEALGFAYYMVRAIGTPGLAYQQTVKLNPTFNRVGSFSIEFIEKTRMVLAYRAHKPERNRNLCTMRQAQFASFPMIWGLPPAEVSETQCQIEGAACCRYEMSWHNPTPAWLRYLGVAAGAGLGLALGWLELSHPALTVTLLAIGGGAVGAMFDYRRDLRRKDEFLHAQNEGMMGSLRDLEKRYEEVQRAKVGLEERVVERTSQLSEANDKLKVALAKQQELDRLKTQFFTNISHELRTPLTLILAPLETALNDLPPGDLREQLTTAHRNGLRLLKHINSLLDLSRLDAGRMRLKLEDTEPVAFMRQLAEATQGLARSRNITLEFVEEGGPVPAIPLDRDKAEKVFLNLLGNALKFTGEAPDKVARVTVRCGAIPEEARFRFSVTDTGIGIPADQQQAIFERFHQVDGAETRNYGGTGIGLALVKEFVEFHMGTVEVSSTEGVGSTFTVTLPMKPEVYPDDRLDRRRDRKQVVLDRRSGSDDAKKVAEILTQGQMLQLADIAVVEQQHPAENPDKETLLLVDDNRDMLNYLGGLLSKEYRVVTAQDGDMAFRVALQELPAIIVSDVMMPKRSGSELLRDLRREDRTKHIPVILVTARADVQSKVTGLDQGADDYVTKPFNFYELRARIRSLLALRSAQRDLAEKNDYLSKLNLDLVLSKKETFTQTIEALAYALEAKDRYTHGHSRRVSILSWNLSRGLSLSESDCEKVRISAVLHDVGKIGVPESVLLKEGKLDPEEWVAMQLHPVIGARILEQVKELQDIAKCILFHHEKFNGTGYPEGRRGKDIPFESRIIAVADTYDAMTSDRPYRQALPHKRAVEEIAKFSGEQFDPVVVECFMRLFEARGPTFPEVPGLSPRGGWAAAVARASFLRQF